MTIASLIDRIAKGENATTEFKRSAKVENAGRAVCSFLNGDGGNLFCGVGDDGSLLGVGGDAPALARELELGLKAAISPAPVLAVDSVEIDGRQILVVEVPKAPDGPYAFAGGVWLRMGEETRAATIVELRGLLRGDAQPPRWERQASPAMTDADLDLDEVRATVREAIDNGRFSFSNPEDTQLVLKELSVLGFDGFTQAGDALFSRTPGRRHPQCRAQLVVYAGDKADDEYLDNRWFEGPLFRTCTDLVQAVIAANPIKSTFERGALQRRDAPAYEAFAIREGIVNAFVHRDYAAYSGGLKVSVYRDRIEIWNSGSLPEGLTPSDLRRDHGSILVNPDIVQIFYLRGLMERVGRGTEYIVRASKRLGAPPPQWRDQASGVTLTIHSAHAQRPGRTSPNSRQAALLAALGIGEAISVRDYVAQFGMGITDRQGRRDLDDLVRSADLIVEGAGPATVYRRKNR
ncbi:RNA-binding domain-containing protein [Sphingomonas sp.]|uniref:RNA-binding domain-containing protein n=1 Tax=Sphingomonas sp. TaxID=28214 RepID=UPI000DB0D6D8|nr:RNA-binding domain-containing protein [Sphingomonas sp.]PZU05971.1 MAG: transcriptional regulator [Sphingomonas sp.]